ncbi:hypothetical protein [Nocardia sp. NPDC004750]
MTTPNLPNESPPSGTLGVGLFRALQQKTVDEAKATMSGGIMGAFEHTQDTLHSEYNIPLENTRVMAVAASDQADVAMSTAEAAANEAANAGELADIAYENAHEWSLEFVCASAAVELGRNELLLGPMLNVRGNRTAILTDVHIALLEQPGGITIDTRKWNASVTSFTVAHTGTLDPNVTLRSFSGLTVPVLDKERFFPNVAAVVGTVAPNVLQICVAGVYIPL